MSRDDLITEGSELAGCSGDENKIEAFPSKLEGELLADSITRASDDSPCPRRSKRT